MGSRSEKKVWGKTDNRRKEGERPRLLQEAQQPGIVLLHLTVGGEHRENLCGRGGKVCPNSFKVKGEGRRLSNNESGEDGRTYRERTINLVEQQGKRITEICRKTTHLLYFGGKPDTVKK